MKRIICYLRTLKHFDFFLICLFNYGAVYIDHDYVEKYTKYIKSRDRAETKLVCQTCGDITISWYDGR